MQKSEHLMASLTQNKQPIDRNNAAHLDDRPDFLLNKGLVHLSQLEPTDSLEQTSAIVGSWEMGVLEHLLCDLAIELG